MKIAVAGGTGLVGALTVVAVREAGHQPITLARSTGVDLVTGSGLDAALDGASAVIDVSNIATTRRDTAVAFFEAATRNLIAARVPHLVALSIVGIDRVDFGYYEGKRRQEALLLDGGGPVSILRATQFHEFAAQMAARKGGPFALIPRMRSQTIAAREVADALVRIALGEPVGHCPDLAGPEIHDMPDLVRRLLAARGSRRIVVSVRLPGAAGRAMASDGLLPTGPGPRGTQTFDEWLAETRR